jgi:hypothetical protein
MQLRGACRGQPWGAVRALTVAIAWLLCAVSPAGVQAAPPRRQVVLHAGALVQNDPQLFETVRELLSRAQLELVTPSRAGEDRVLAWVDVESTDGGAQITVRSPATDTFVQRQVQDAESPALFRETLAHVILGVVEPLASDQPETTPEAPASTSASSEVPEDARAFTLSSPRSDAASRGGARSASAPSVALGLRGGPLLLSSDRLVAQLGGQAILRFASALRPALGLEAAGIWPATLDDDGLGARVRLLSVRLVPGLRLLDGTRGAIDVALAPGVDVLSFAAQPDDGRLRRAQDSRRVQPMLGARFTASLRLSRLLELLLGLGADYDFAPRRWVVATPSGSREVLETLRVRPYAYAGLGVTLFAGAQKSP